MARIRTIKPEFWTDGRIVTLPYQARLLFIGLLNFADDHGFIGFEPDRLKMQIFPSDDIDMSNMLDLLAAADLLELYRDDNSDVEFLRVKNWEKHQKVDKPSKTKFPRESSRKLAIPNEVRRQVALKYGCEPGGSVCVNCYYCGIEGSIYWWKKANGEPSYWVSTSLSYDHLIAEFHGGNTENDNIVLACHSCNKAKRHKDYVDFFLAKAREASIPFAVGSRIKDQGSRKGKERKGVPAGSQSARIDATEIAPPLATTAQEPGKDLTRQIWETYRSSYKLRYGVEPVRNASVNAKISQLAKRLGAEAVPVVEFFLRHNKQFYAQKLHDIGLCLADAEALRTQWAKGKAITETDLRNFARARDTQQTLEAIERGEI